MEFYLLNGEFVAHGDIFLVFVYFLVCLSSPDFYKRIKSYNFEFRDKMWKCGIYVLHQLKREVAKVKIFSAYR